MLQKKNVMLCYSFVAAMAVLTPTLARQLPTLEELHVNSQIMMRYAKTQVTYHMFNQHPFSTSINFPLLLPEKAFVTAFSMISDGIEYNATIEDVDFADETYSRIESLDEEAGLIAKRSRDTNIFEVSMTARPFKRVTFKLTHEQVLSRENGLYTLPIHLHPGETSAKISVTVTINETSPITKLQVTELHDYIQHGAPKKNTDAVINKSGDRFATITWNPTTWWMTNRAVLNGVMEVQYDVAASNEVYLDERGNFVQMIKVDERDPLPKNVVFVLDISGSMEGQKLRQLKEAMTSILNELGPKDEFSFIFFSTKPLIWTGSYNCRVLTSKARLPQMAVLSVTSVNISKAKRCIGSLRANGGTDIHESLGRAIDASKIALQRNGRRTEKRQLMMMFLTDGKPNGIVADPSRITQIFTERNAEVNASLFGIGFGDDADFKFLKKITLQNGGFSKRVYEAEDAAKQLENFYKLISAPVLSNVKFVYDNVDQLTLETPNNIPIFFNGSSAVQAGKVAPGSGVSGTITSEQGATQMPPATLVTGKLAEFMNRLKVYLTIQALLQKTDQESADKARDLALANGFVTKYTALIVTRPEDESVIPYEAPTTPGRSSSFSPVEEFEVLPDLLETPFTGLGLEDIQWLIPIGNNSYAMPATNENVTKLEIGIHKDVVRYDPCTTPENKEGHCYHLHQCVLQDFQEDFNTFTSYYCNIQNRYVGVCCPDEYTTSAAENTQSG